MPNHDLAAIQADLPRMVTSLAKTMADEAIQMMIDTDLTLEDTQPSIAIIYAPKDGSAPFRVRLSIDLDVDED